MRFVSNKLKHWWTLIRDFCIYKVLHADDPPHRLALGIAVGMFVTFLPLIGIQMVLNVFLAWLLNANKVVGVPLVWISNPLTIGPIYYPCYLLGCTLLGEGDQWEQIKTRWSAQPPSSFMSGIGFMLESAMDMAGPLGLGCIIVASVMGVISYYVSLFFVRAYRLKRWGQLMPPKVVQEHLDEGDVSAPDHP